MQHEYTVTAGWQVMHPSNSVRSIFFRSFLVSRLLPWPKSISWLRIELGSMPLLSEHEWYWMSTRLKTVDWPFDAASGVRLLRTSGSQPSNQFCSPHYTHPRLHHIQHVLPEAGLCTIENWDCCGRLIGTNNHQKGQSSATHLFLDLIFNAHVWPTCLPLVVC